MLPGMPNPVRTDSLTPEWTDGRRLFAAFAMIVLPVWGLVVNSAFLEFQLLASPDVYAFYGLYGITVLAYVRSRLCPELQPEWDETALFGGMACGIVVAATLMIHFGGYMVLPILLSPFGGFSLLFLPAVAPLLVFVLQVREFRRRARRRARDGMAGAPGQGWLAGVSLLLLYAVLMGAVKQAPFAALDVFTAVNKGTFGSRTFPNWR